MIFVKLYPQLFLVRKVIISTKTFTALTTFPAVWCILKINPGRVEGNFLLPSDNGEF